MADSAQFRLFEVLPDGTASSRGSANTVESVWNQLRVLSRNTKNECFAVQTATRRVVGQLNLPEAPDRTPKQIFQITYAHEMAIERAQIMRFWGYQVSTFVGNENAKAALESKPSIDLFIVGHAAPEETRNEMVGWLRDKYPGVKIVALNPMHQSISGADYNVKLNGPETWLPVVAKAVA